MSPRELAAFNAGLRHAADLALISALALELRPDAAHTRQQAAIAALRGLAEGLTAVRREDRLATMMRAIAADPAASGVTACPDCAGRLQWTRDSSNGHLSGQCETEGVPTMDAVGAHAGVIVPGQPEIEAAWRSLPPETRDRIGIAVVDMVFQEFVHGDAYVAVGQPEDLAVFDEGIRTAAAEAANRRLNELTPLIEGLFPHLFGHPGENPAWCENPGGRP